MPSFHLSLKNIFQSGGVTLAALILLSIYSWGRIWERYHYYKKSLADLPRFLERLRRLFTGSDLKEAVTLCKQYPGPAASVVMATLVGPPGKQERRNSAERALERHVAGLQRGLPTLGTIGSISPFIGLFGTVLGVMRAFRELAAAAGAGPGVVAIGISEALVATAAGLFVAIPAIIAYNYFTTQANQFAEELRWITDELLEILTEKAAR